MSQDHSVEEIIANLDRLLTQAPDKGDETQESETPEAGEPNSPFQPDQIEEFEFVEDGDLVEAAIQAEEEAVDEFEIEERTKRRILLTPDMQLADEQIPLLEAEEIPPLPEQDELEEEAIEEALSFEAVTDEVMEAEEPEEEAPVEEASAETEVDAQLAVEEASAEEIPEEGIELAELSAEEAIDDQAAPEPIDASAVAETVCSDVLENLREILPLMVEESLKRALEGQSQQQDQGGEDDSQR